MRTAETHPKMPSRYWIVTTTVVLPAWDIGMPLYRNNETPPAV